MMETLDPMASPPNVADEIRQVVVAINHAVATEKIICFGSVTHHVEQKCCFPGAEPIAPAAKNSYALLVIPEAGGALFRSAIERCVEKATQGIADVTVIVHTVAEVNAALGKGSAFFSAIHRRGALVHDRNGVSFEQPAQGGPVAERIAKRERFWQRRQALAEGFLQGAAFYRTVNQPAFVVYMLRQALRECYVGVLRVMTGYIPNGQGVYRLLRLVETTVAYSGLTLPRHTPGAACIVGILSNKYGDAGSVDTYEGSDEDLATLMDGVSAVISAADQHCRIRIQRLKESKVAYLV